MKTRMEGTNNTSNFNPCGKHDDIDKCLHSLKEDNVLIFERLGIREKANGERKEQLRYAQDKISEVQKEGERCDANLFVKIDELQKYLVNLIVKIFLILGFGVIIMGVILLVVSKII